MALVKHFEPLIKSAATLTMVSVTAVRYDEDIWKKDVTLKLDQAKAVTDVNFGHIAPRAPDLVQTQLRADANSSVPTGVWAAIDTFANELSGGRSRAILFSPALTRALDAIDGFFAGLLDTLTMSLSTKLRAVMWGDAATRNHESGWFTAGSLVGTAIMLFVNPCNFGTVGQIAYRVMNGGDLIESGVGAYRDIMAGNYLSAGLKIASMVMNLANLGKACFTGEMEVITRRGWVRWDALTVDDEVLAGDEYDPNGALEYKHVEEMFVTYARIWHLHVDGEVIRTTAEHPFFVVGKGWIPCAELTVGDQLRTHDGKSVRVEDVVDGGYEEKVYNCRVADWHTYFVRANDGCSVWAHNTYKIVGTTRVPTGTVGGGFQGYVSKQLSGIRQKYEKTIEVVVSATQKVRAKVDTLTRWWIVEAKYSPWNVAKGFYSKVQIGSKRHKEMVDQMTRLLEVANKTGKKGVMVVSTTDKSNRNLQRLYSADANLAKAIKDGQIVFKKINWWGR